MSIRRDLLMRSALLRLPDLAALRALAPTTAGATAADPARARPRPRRRPRRKPAAGTA